MRLSIGLAAAVAATTATAKWIVPGARWLDTDGELVNAHAGCVTLDRESGKFFLFGECTYLQPALLLSYRV